MLDSAYCCKANRGCFHEILQSEEYFIREEFSLDQMSSLLPNRLNGLPKIGKSVRSVVMRNGFSEEQGLSLARHCHNLTRLYYAGPMRCMPDVWNIVCASNRIDTLELHVRHNVASSICEDLTPIAMLLPNVRTWAIAGFTDRQVVHVLQKAINLVRLDLFGARISEATILQIPPLCPFLTSLGLTGIRVCDNFLAQLTALCPQMQYLDIEDVARVTDVGIEAVAMNLKALRGINIKENPRLTDSSLVHIYTHCANTLQVLHMNCRFDDGIGHMFRASETNILLQRCTQLRVLNFGYFHEGETFDPQITLRNSTLSNLTTLILGGNVVCDRNLIAIGKYGMNLEILGIKEPSSYTFTTLVCLYEGCPKLKQFYFDFMSTSAANNNANFCALAKFAHKPQLVFGSFVPDDVQDFNLFSL